MLRVAGSLITGKVRAYDLIRMMSPEGRHTSLGEAFAHYGRVFKTLHVLQLRSTARRESWVGHCYRHAFSVAIHPVDGLHAIQPGRTSVGKPPGWGHLPAETVLCQGTGPTPTTT